MIRNRKLHQSMKANTTGTCTKASMNSILGGRKTAPHRFAFLHRSVTSTTLENSSRRTSYSFSSSPPSPRSSVRFSLFIFDQIFSTSWSWSVAKSGPDLVTCSMNAARPFAEAMNLMALAWSPARSNKTGDAAFSNPRFFFASISILGTLGQHGTKNSVVKVEIAWLWVVHDIL